MEVRAKKALIVERFVSTNFIKRTELTGPPKLNTQKIPRDYKVSV